MLLSEKGKTITAAWRGGGEDGKGEKMAMKTNIVFLPVPSAGHMHSTLEFAKRLLLHPTAAGRLSVTFLLMPEYASTFSSLLPQPSTNYIDAYLLPDIDAPTLDATDGVEEYISIRFQLYTPHVKSALVDTAATALIMDFFATTVIDAANDLHIPAYIFFSSNATMLAVMLHLPALHNEIQEEFEQLEGQVKVPGLTGIPPTSMPMPVMNKKNRCYNWFVYHGRRFKEVKGIIPNTSWAFEPQVLSALESDKSVPPVHPVGPVIRVDRAGGGGERHECLRWLDGQPVASVVFLCFGSMCGMTATQAAEVAVGIERSGHRFLWSLRFVEGESEGLPSGFREATNGRGLVFEGWVPQVEVLAHAAVGGFVMHGGWNSCLESLWFGVPMVAWPMYAEQHLNAFLMAAEMGVAAETEIDRRRGGWVTAQEVERKLKWLMGDSEDVKKVKKRVREMKEASREAVEIGGSSYNWLETLVKDFLGLRGVGDK